ncbi:MAG: hypothetical protein RR854_00430 [Muribaculaceae bacterium]
MIKIFKQWRERLLRKKIVCLFLKNNKYDPSIYDFNDIDRYVRYIKKGIPKEQ